MSIAYEINRLQISKADTKEQVNIDKDYINTGIDFIESETVDGYDEKIQEMQEAYKAFIPVNTTSDTQIDAPKGGTIIGKALKGNTSQDGTPTPSAPVVVENATGLQKIKVTKKNLFDVSTLVNKSYNGASSSTRVCNSQAIYLTPGTYTFSTNINTSTYEFKTDVLKNPPTSPITESYIYNSGFGTSNPRTITITSPGYFAILIRKNDNTGINDFTLKEFTYQLEKGSSATTYEEYQDTTLYMNRNKNLLKINDVSKTINGITFTENSDGSIHAEGTATDLALYGTNTLLPIIPTQRYRLSGCPEGGSLSSYYISIMLKNESGSSIGSFADIGDGVFGDFIAPDNARYMYAQILVLSGTTINATFYPQLELGSEITAYKEYEPLQEGNYEINLGKNLLEPKMASVTINGVTCTNNGDGTFTLNGTATAQATFRLDQSTYNGRDNLKNYNGTYTFSCDQLQANDMDLILMQVNTWSIVLRMNGSNTPVTGNVNKDNCFIYVQVRDGKSVNNLTIRPMLEKSPIATSYSPYFTPIELNKIGDYQDFIKKGTGKNICNNADIEAGFPSGGIGSQIGITSSVNSVTYKKCCYVEKSKTYTLSWKRNTPKAEGSRDIKIVDENNIILESIAYSNASSIRAKTFTPNNSGYIYVAVDTNATEVQIEENSSATYYEPYGYGGKWYIEKNIGKVILNGSETWNAYSTSVSDHYRYATNISDIKKTSSATEVPNILSNRYSKQVMGTAGSWGAHQGIAVDNTNTRIYINDDTYYTNDATSFKTWLTSNNVIAYYALSSPTYTLIENEDLIEQLEKIMPLLEGQNNISVDGSIPVYMDLDYIVKADRYLIGNRREGK